jgi:hypothetical protein
VNSERERSVRLLVDSMPVTVTVHAAGAWARAYDG